MYHVKRISVFLSKLTLYCKPYSFRHVVLYPPIHSFIHSFPLLYPKLVCSQYTLPFHMKRALKNRAEWPASRS